MKKTRFNAIYLRTKLLVSYSSFILAFFFLNVLFFTSTGNVLLDLPMMFLHLSHVILKISIDSIACYGIVSLRYLSMNDLNCLSFLQDRKCVVLFLLSIGKTTIYNSFIPYYLHQFRFYYIYVHFLLYYSIKRVRMLIPY